MIRTSSEISRPSERRADVKTRSVRTRGVPLISEAEPHYCRLVASPSEEVLVQLDAEIKRATKNNPAHLARIAMAIKRVYV